MDRLSSLFVSFRRVALIGACALSFAACGSGSSSADKDRAPVSPPLENPAPPVATTYAVGGRISGLTAAGLVLQNNGGDDLVIAADDDAFTFATKIAAGGAYRVTVATQPEGQTCTVGSGVGQDVAANVDDVAIVCSTDTYTVGGSVAGLTMNGLVLQNNGADDLAVVANATTLRFATPVAHDGGYHVTVLAQPLGLVCTVGGGVGSHVAANVESIHVACSAATFSIGGAVSGLTASGLVLRNNGGDDLVVPVNATSLQFATPVAFGGAYNVTVLHQPIGQTCTIGQGAGSPVASAVNDVMVVCSVDTFAIGGAISNLTAGGLVLQNNGADALAVPANATSFQFATPVAYGGSYNATILQQPSSQVCNIDSNGADINVTANVTAIAISCVGLHTVGGVVTGLSGSVTLQNNAGDDLVLNADGPFTLATPVVEGAPYNVTVLVQPAGQTCTITNGSGTIGAANVTNVGVDCIAIAPNLSSISPSVGTTAGFDSVTITGTGLFATISVTFDGVPATNIVVVDDSTITLTTPAHALGTVDVVVTTNGGSTTASNAFTYQ